VAARAAARRKRETSARRKESHLAMNSNQPLVIRSELRDILVRVRDFATSLLGDPTQGDRAVRRAMRRLRRFDPKRELRGRDLEDWLNDCVVGLCAEAYFPESAARLAWVDPCEWDDCGDADDDSEDPDPQDDPPDLLCINLDPERKRDEDDMDEQHPFKEAA
jgi:hypothetical protein